MNWIALLVTLIINLFIIYFLKISIHSCLKNILKLLPFILFVIAINLISMDINNSMMVGVKLILVCNSTYIYSQITTITEFSKTISELLVIFKFNKIKNKDIELLLNIAISMMPLIKKEIKQLIESCKEKNMLFNIKNSKYIFSKLFTSILIRTDNINNALKEKGY